MEARKKVDLKQAVALLALAATGASMTASGISEPALAWSGRVTSAAGLLQITRDFCDHSNAICEQCRFPELIAGWSGGTAQAGAR